MRFTENRSDEIRAMVQVITHELRLEKTLSRKERRKKSLGHLNWFYNQVADLVERQEDEDHKRRVSTE